jgi:hypothetical protein
MTKTTQNGSNGHRPVTVEDAKDRIRERSERAEFAFEFVDLSEMVRDGVDPPKMLFDGLLYEGASHWFSGHPKHGKTILVMHVAIELIERGRHVIWLDYEGGPRRTARRLDEMAADPDNVGEYFHYQYAPQTTADDSVIRAFEAALEKWPGALVVYDSQAKALRRAGLSEDKADEVTEWTQNLVLKLTNTQDATVAVIDHMPKTGTSRSRYARGSGAKAADADVSWFVEKASEFNRRQKGRIEVTLWHDRDGEMSDGHVFEIGDGDGGLPVVRVNAEAHSEETALMAQAAEVLRKQGPLKHGKLAEALGKPRNNGTLKRALGRGLEEGVLRRETKRGPYELGEAGEVPM